MPQNLNQQLIDKCLDLSDNDAAIQELIKQGAEVNCHEQCRNPHSSSQGDTWYTPLTATLEAAHLTMTNRTKRIVQILLEEGADPAVMDKKDYTPLLCAIKRAYTFSVDFQPSLTKTSEVIEIIRLLVSHMKKEDLDFLFDKCLGGEFNLIQKKFSEKFTALQFVMMPWLSGSNNSIFYSEYKLPKPHLIYFYQYEISKILIDAGADIGLVDSKVINLLLKKETLLDKPSKKEIINSLSNIDDFIGKKLISYSLKKVIPKSFFILFLQVNGFEPDKEGRDLIKKNNNILNFLIADGISVFLKNIEDKKSLLTNLINIKKSVKNELEKLIYNILLCLINEKIIKMEQEIESKHLQSGKFSKPFKKDLNSLKFLPKSSFRFRKFLKENTVDIIIDLWQRLLKKIRRLFYRNLSQDSSEREQLLSNSLAVVLNEETAGPSLGSSSRLTLEKADIRRNNLFSTSCSVTNLETSEFLSPKP